MFAFSGEGGDRVIDNSGLCFERGAHGKTLCNRSFIPPSQAQAIYSNSTFRLMNSLTETVSSILPLPLSAS